MIKTICVIGIWHLGIVNAIGFAEQGYSVIGIDFDNEKVDNLNKGIPPLFEPNLENLMQKHLEDKTLLFSNNIQLVSEADAVIIAYDSPVNEFDEVDISPIIDASIKIIPYLKENSLLVITSQVPLGSCEKIYECIKNLFPNWKSGVVYVPENLKLGTAIDRFLNPDMLVLGTKKEFYSSALELYNKFNCTKLTMNWRSSEMVKHALNTFLATSITFINEIANLSDLLGADAVEVGKALKLDSRIGKQALMMPGLGFSGGTLARDVMQLRKFAREFDYDAKLLNSIIDINEATFDKVISKLTNKLLTLDGRKIGILGLTYKPGTSTLRRSPSIKIAEKIVKLGAKCVGYDPKADINEVGEYENIIEYENDIINFSKELDAIILVTEWEEFKSINFNILFMLVNNAIIVDCKNFLNPDIVIAAGFDYQGFGRKRDLII